MCQPKGCGCLAGWESNPVLLCDACFDKWLDERAQARVGLLERDRQDRVRSVDEPLVDYTRW